MKDFLPIFGYILAIPFYSLLLYIISGGIFYESKYLVKKYILNRKINQNILSKDNISLYDIYIIFHENGKKLKTYSHEIVNIAELSNIYIEKIKPRTNF